MTRGDRKVHSSRRRANIGLFSVPLTICMEFPKHFKFLRSSPPAVPTDRPSNEKEGEACCRNPRFPVCIPPSPAESVLPFACPTPFARLESSFWPKRSFEESPLLLPIKAEQMILPSLFKIEQFLHSSATTLSFVRCPMMESSPYLSRPVIVQSRK